MSDARGLNVTRELVTCSCGSSLDGSWKCAEDETYVPASQNDALVPWDWTLYLLQGSYDGAYQLLWIIVDLYTPSAISTTHPWRLVSTGQVLRLPYLDIQNDPYLLQPGRGQPLQ